jgi:hypothetical protein
VTKEKRSSTEYFLFYHLTVAIDDDSWSPSISSPGSFLSEDDEVVIESIDGSASGVCSGVGPGNFLYELDIWSNTVELNSFKVTESAPSIN